MLQLLQDKPNVFQHGGAPPHIHSEVTTFLNMQLPEQWIGRGGLLASAISRPDPLEFFLLNLVKDEVYFPPMPITLNNLKDRTRKEIAKLDQTIVCLCVFILVFWPPLRVLVCE
jgi:hypothetical protein